MISFTPAAAIIKMCALPAVSALMDGARKHTTHLRKRDLGENIPPFR
jgi:hypothetical protein